jgi:perosamine synthetase
MPYNLRYPITNLEESTVIHIAKPQIGAEEKQAVLEVLDSGVLAQGPRVKAFEAAFAKMCGVKHAIATTSGTTALHVALLAHNIGEGDEVITSPFTFIATINSILFTGARPVLSDIDPATFNLNPALVEEVITPRTKAILPVHLFGLTANMGAFMDIANRHGLLVIEDACQAHGAEYNGKCAGSFGTGAFSLYATKNMTSVEGGMITTSDDTIAASCRAIRQHGMRQHYYYDKLGYNYCMSDVHAAIGLAQLGKLQQFNNTRIANAAYYDRHLTGVIKPTVPAGCRHVYHQYTVRVPDGQRDVFVEHMKNEGVGCEIYYPIPIHKQSYFIDKVGQVSEKPVAEQAAREVVSLPIHPALSTKDLRTVVDAVNSFTG